MEITLIREQPERGATMGILALGGLQLQTIERPWIPTDPGGKPFRSCVPAGCYEVFSHIRPSGERALSLVNEGHAVYYTDNMRPADVGRYLILIHAANWSDQLAGCIAPGLGRSVTERGPMVTESRRAMRALLDAFDASDERAFIQIRWREKEPARL